MTNLVVILRDQGSQNLSRTMVPGPLGGSKNDHFLDRFWSRNDQNIVSYGPPGPWDLSKRGPKTGPQDPSWDPSWDMGF